MVDLTLDSDSRTGAAETNESEVTEVGTAAARVELVKWKLEGASSAEEAEQPTVQILVETMVGKARSANEVEAALKSANATDNFIVAKRYRGAGRHRGYIVGANWGFCVIGSSECAGPRY